jgi:hypothetical protein
MKKVTKLWAPLLVGVLLMSTLVGVASARPNTRPREQGWLVLTVPSTACFPDQDGYNWAHAAWGVVCNVGLCQFMCNLDFPTAGAAALGSVKVKRVTMFGEDNTSGQGAVFYLYKQYPPTHGFVVMANGSTVDSPSDPQAVIDGTIANNPIYRVQAPYIWLLVGTSINVYGFHIHYTW